MKQHTDICGVGSKTTLDFFLLRQQTPTADGCRTYRKEKNQLCFWVDDNEREQIYERMKDASVGKSINIT
jgi:hypothetical protein